MTDAEAGPLDLLKIIRCGCNGFCGAKCSCRNGVPSPSLLRLPSFLRIPHPPTLPANRPSQVFFINRNATVKLSSINSIHVKQQHNVGFFIFKLTLNYMLGNAYINKIHATQCLYIISLYCREGFSNHFNFSVLSK